MLHRRVNILTGALALAALGVALPGCLVGPKYARPAIEQPTGFKSLATTQPTTQATTQAATQPMPTDWWRMYRDPQLDELIASAHESNQTLRQAVARVDQARALAHVAASFQLPTVTADPNYTRTRTSANRASVITGKPVGISSVSNDWRGGFGLSLNI